MNPDLIPIGTSSQDANSQRVQPLQTLTAAFPTTLLDKFEHYACSLPTASMHRPDGKRLGFVFGHFMTNILEDVKYLEGEIARGNLYIRKATSVEIREAMMRKDPKGTMKEELRPEIEGELRAELEAKIRAELSGVNVSSVSGSLEQVADRIVEEVNRVKREELDAAKIAGTDALSALKNKLAAPIKSGTASVVMASVAAPLKGIVGSDSVKDLAADGPGG